MENLTESLMLMVVGMTTVFAVLCLVILMGNILISLINKYFPEKETKVVPVQGGGNTINPHIANAINSAVNTITEGKGKVEKIEKL